MQNCRISSFVMVSESRFLGILVTQNDKDSNKSHKKYPSEVFFSTFWLVRYVCFNISINITKVSVHFYSIKSTR